MEKWEEVKRILSDRYGYKYLDGDDYGLFLRLKDLRPAEIAERIAESIRGGSDPLNDR